MFRNFAMVTLLMAGITGWHSSNAQVTACDWSVGGTTCDGGGTFSTVGTANYMIAHRMERHSIVTSDGAIHVVVNNGTNLELYTSSDYGVHWTNQTVNWGGTNIFANTSYLSTSDVAVPAPGVSAGVCSGTDYMTVVFNDESQSQVEEACLSWATGTNGAAGNGWTVETFFPALSSTLAPGTTYS
jgi:hypothetical protein